MMDYDHMGRTATETSVNWEIDLLNSSNKIGDDEGNSMTNNSSRGSGIISKNPLEMDAYNFWFHCGCCAVGLPLNFYIAFGLCDRKKKLYEKPRNILLLSLVVCNILTLLMAIDEIVYYFWPDESVCRLFVTVIELPYILFFFNLLLSLVDRYVAMARPVWHHSNVTVPFVSFWLVVLNASLALAVNWVYVTGAAELRCQIEMSQAKTLDATLLVLCVSCIVFTVVDYVETRTLLPIAPHRQSSCNSATIAVPTLSSSVLHRDGDGAMAHHFNPPPPVVNEPTAAAPEATATMGVHMNVGTLQRMETEATRTLMAGIIALVLLPCPLLIFTFTHLICMLLHPQGDQCDDIIWLAPYFKELVTLHALIHPIVVVLRNKDLKSSSSSNSSTSGGAAPITPSHHHHHPHPPAAVAASNSSQNHIV